MRSAVDAPTKSIRACGAISTWRPRVPALTNMVSKSVAVEWKKVGSGYFMPIGEQPPRI